MKMQFKLNNWSEHFTILFLFIGLFGTMAFDHTFSYADSLASINSPDYGLEDDNLELSGKIIEINRWSNIEYQNLNSQLFEPITVKIKVLTNADGCDKPKLFYLKRGINPTGLKENNILNFTINKNSCDREKALVITEIHYWHQEKKENERK